MFCQSKAGDYSLWINTIGNIVGLVIVEMDDGMLMDGNFISYGCLFHAEQID